MKTLGTALTALALTFSGSALADWDDHRRHGHHGGHDRHGHWKHRDHHRHHSHPYYGPTVRYGYYPAPVYAAPPYPYYGPPPYSYHRPRHNDGVTIILPPVRIGF